MKNVTVPDHPLIKHKLTFIRDRRTETWLFRQFVNELTYLMLFEATRDLRTREEDIETPLAPTRSEVLGEDIVVVPILRAGLGMLDGFLRLAPMSKVGFVGLYRDEETLEPVEYYCKTPDMSDAGVFVLDPMLATGGSVSEAVTALKRRGAQNIVFICLLAAPEGIAALEEAHPDVKIYCAAVDEGLNDDGYIVPGIGDCGDRLFNTI